MAKMSDGGVTGSYPPWPKERKLICESRLPANAGALFPHVRIDAKRTALDVLAVGVKTDGCVTNCDTKPVGGTILSAQLFERMAGTTGLEPAASAVTGNSGSVTT